MAVEFVSDDGSVIPAVTAEQMREIDRIAIEDTGPNLFQMMENAGRNLALHCLDVLGSSWRRARVVVLAGAGGNGGGGICAARHLANRGIDVALVLSDPARVRDVPAFQRKVYASTRGREIEATALGHEQPHLIIDALIGYGLRSAPRGRAADLIAWANESGAPITVLDVPSGLNATTGERPGPCIRAHTTLTLALPKTGLTTDDVGGLWLSDIGIPRRTFERAGVTFIDPFGRHSTISLTRQPASKRS
jgi:NAD(P)H-hydrate epimerase